MLFPSMGFAICAIIFVIFITVIYFKKKKFDSLENSIYRFLLILTIIILVIELLSVVTMSKYETSKLFNILNIITTRSYLIGCILWTTLLSLYIWASSRRQKPKAEVKKSFKKVLVFSIFIDIILSSLVLFFNDILDYKYISNDPNLYVIGGKVTYVLYAVSSFLVLVLFIALTSKKSKIPFIQKFPLYFTFILFLTTTAAQFYTFDFNDLSYIFAFAVVAMYFTIENQDSKLLKQLEESKEESIRADKAKTEFLANMSHEIRTPMNTILGFSESLLREDNLNEDIVKRDSKSIYDASVTLLDLINNILDISRIESGKEVVNQKDYSLESVILDVNSAILPKINKDSLEFKINVNIDMPSVYYGDSSKITKILTLVLVNAISYTNFGSVRLDVDGSYFNELYELKFIISNTGHAMKIEDFEKDFEDFVKLGNSTQNNIDSVTLGFIIAKKLVQMLGGEMKFLNEKGMGTKYYIKIAQKIVNSNEIGNIFEDKGELSNTDILNLSDKKILVVDDNKVNITLVSRLLKRYSPIIMSATSGTECLNLVKLNKFDLIFLDHMMPEMDGVETLKCLKESGYSIPPVIALTANSYTGAQEEYKKYGFYDYLSKPINFKDLNKMIYEVFNENE